MEFSKNNTNFAKSIMTTDTFVKQKAIRVKDDSGEYTIAGVAKGAGMIHPDMATMLCFITTDADIEKNYLKTALKRATDCAFNMITVDGDTSPSDTVIVIANGLAKNEIIKNGTGNGFQKALSELCIFLAKCIAKDGEGATKLVEVHIEGAAAIGDARLASRIVANSPLVKTAIHGNDPNWGRIIVAIGRSGAEIIENKVDLYLNGVCVMKQGKPIDFNKKSLSKNMADNKTTTIHVNLNIRNGSATAWGCDLSKEYVTINSAYTT
jgi:glutamate N-acetyltransferase/amino-acid N-acetyltransferase